MKKIAFLLPLLLVSGSCETRSHNDPILASDLNVDGYADIVVGAPLHDGGGAAGANRGAIFIFWGSPNGPSASPNITIYGPEDASQFGAALAFVGDVNGGGAPDLAVGAPLDDGDGASTDAGTDKGRLFIFYGGSSMDAVADITITGEETGGRFSFSVARAGDVNADGFDDWIVGAPYDDADDITTDSGDDKGRAYLFLGGSPPTASPAATYSGSENSSRFGWAVSSAGDLNVGGADDVAVGAPLDDAGAGAGANRGRVYVFHGGGSLDNIADLTLSGDENGAEFGSAVAYALDVNGDGKGDLLVGAPGHDSGGAPGADGGRAYLFYGSAAIDATPDVMLPGLENSARFGTSVGRLGDVNGDGENDLIVGAPYADFGALTDAGRAHVFLGGPGIDSAPDVTFSGDENGGRYGIAVAGFGDLNGGGFRDLYVGASRDDADNTATDDGLDRGRVFLHLGGSTIDGTAEAVLSGTENGAEFGTTMAN